MEPPHGIRFHRPSVHHENEYTEDETKRALSEITYHQLAASTGYADIARLNRVKMRYDISSSFWQKAASVLPEENMLERANYLYAAGYDLHYIGRRDAAMVLYEASLAIRRALGDVVWQAIILQSITSLQSGKPPDLSILS
jgi:tetratricopeptide (TPR) repeat protein